MSYIVYCIRRVGAFVLMKFSICGKWKRELLIKLNCPMGFCAVQASPAFAPDPGEFICETLESL